VQLVTSHTFASHICKPTSEAISLIQRGRTSALTTVTARSGSGHRNIYVCTSLLIRAPKSTHVWSQVATKHSQNIINCARMYATCTPLPVQNPIGVIILPARCHFPRTRNYDHTSRRTMISDIPVHTLHAWAHPAVHQHTILHGPLFSLTSVPITLQHVRIHPAMGVPLLQGKISART